MKKHVTNVSCKIWQNRCLIWMDDQCLFFAFKGSKSNQLAWQVQHNSSAASTVWNVSRCKTRFSSKTFNEFLCREVIQTDETDKTKPFEPSEMYDDHSSRPGFLQLWPTSNDTAQTQHSFSVRFPISAQGFTWCGETTSYPLIGLWVLSNACYVYKSPRPTWLDSIWSLSKAMDPCIICIIHPPLT